MGKQSWIGIALSNYIWVVEYVSPGIALGGHWCKAVLV